MLQRTAPECALATSSRCAPRVRPRASEALCLGRHLLAALNNAMTVRGRSTARGPKPGDQCHPLGHLNVWILHVSFCRTLDTPHQPATELRTARHLSAPAAHQIAMPGSPAAGTLTGSVGIGVSVHASAGYFSRHRSTTMHGNRRPVAVTGGSRVTGAAEQTQREDGIQAAGSPTGNLHTGICLFTTHQHVAEDGHPISRGAGRRCSHSPRPRHEGR